MPGNLRRVHGLGRDHGGPKKKLACAVGWAVEKHQSETYRRLDCESCESHLVCFRRLTGPVTVEGPDLPDLEVDSRSWEKIIDAVHRRIGNVPVHNCLLTYSVCPESIIDTETQLLLSIYIATGGLSRLRTIEEYLNQPAKWVAVCEYLDELAVKVKGLVHHAEREP